MLQYQLPHQHQQASDRCQPYVASGKKNPTHPFDTHRAKARLLQLDCMGLPILVLFAHALFPISSQCLRRQYSLRPEAQDLTFLVTGLSIGGKLQSDISKKKLKQIISNNNMLQHSPKHTIKVQIPKNTITFNPFKLIIHQKTTSTTPSIIYLHPICTPKSQEVIVPWSGDIPLSNKSN